MTRQLKGRHHKKSNRMIRLAAALMVGGAASAIAVAPVHAQSNDASLRGTITASDGNMPTEVVAVEVDTGYRRTATLGADGRYNFPSLRPGEYWLEITTPKGTRTTDVFVLNVGQSSTFDFDAAESGQAASAEDVGAGITEGNVVIVTGQRIKKMEGGEVGVNITPRLIEALPQNNRNFLAFADLAPGVQFVTGSNDQSRLQGGAMGSNSVNIFIDGVGQKDYVLKNGVTGQDSTQGNPFPQSAVAEYRVISSNYKAEFDQVSSVAVTAVTKSGTNDFHGTGFVDFTNQSLRERRPNEMYPTRAASKTKTKDFQFGGSLSGPIVKDVLHFFVTYEGKRRQNPRDVNPGQSLPISYFPSQYQGVFGPTNETFNENLYFGKINFAPTSKDMFEFSLKYRDEDGETFNSGINAYETRTIIRNKEWRGLGKWTHSEDTWLNEFKVTYEKAYWNPNPYLLDVRKTFNVRVTPTTGGDVLSVGGGRNFQNKGQKGWAVANEFTYTGWTGHTIKTGVKAKWVTLNTTEQNSYNPEFRYHTAFGATFNDTIPYQMSFSAANTGLDPRISSKNFQFGIYIQDDWDVTDRLTLNLGVRWDYDKTPAWLNYVHFPAQVAAVGPTNYPNLINANYNINDYISNGSNRKTFKGAWQPRLGFSYKIDEDGKYVLFGGYGRSYDRTQFDYVQQELAQGITTSRTFNFYGTPNPNPACTPSPTNVTCIAWNPVYLTEAGRTALVSSLPAGAGRELRFINNDLKVPYSDQFSIGLRGNFGLLDAEIGYSYIASHDGFAYLLGNRRPDGSFFVYSNRTINGVLTYNFPGSPFGNPPSPFGSMLIGTNGIETRNNTVYAKLGKRYTKASPWSLDATYTYSKAKENRTYGEYFSLDYPSLDDYPWLRSSGVRTHRFVMVGTVDLPFDMTIGGKFLISSPSWLKRQFETGTTSATQFGTRDWTVIETEGNGDRWGFRQMDLSLTKNFKLGFINEDTMIWFRADILNLFNDRNYSGFSNVTGLRNSSYATDGPPRTIKVSAGFRF